MMYEVLSAKIHNAHITARHLYYGGSITIDSAILKEAGILPNQRVVVVNLNNGARFDTFVIPAPEGSGAIELNGPATRLGEVGDTVHILAYVMLTPQELETFKARFVYLDEENRIQKVEKEGCRLK